MPPNVAVLRIHGGIFRWRFVTDTATHTCQGYNIQYKLVTASTWSNFATYNGSSSPLYNRAIDETMDMLDVVSADVLDDGDYNFRIVAVFTNGSVSPTPANCLVPGANIANPGTIVTLPNLPCVYFKVAGFTLSGGNPAIYLTYDAVPSSYDITNFDLEYTTSKWVNGLPSSSALIPVYTNTTSKAATIVTSSSTIYVRARVRHGDIMGSWCYQQIKIPIIPGSLIEDITVDESAETVTLNYYNDTETGDTIDISLYLQPIVLLGEIQSNVPAPHGSYTQNIDASSLNSLIDGHSYNSYIFQPEDAYSLFLSYLPGADSSTNPIAEGTYLIGGKRYALMDVPLPPVNPTYSLTPADASSTSSITSPSVTGSAPVTSLTPLSLLSSASLISPSVVYTPPATSPLITPVPIAPVTTTRKTAPSYTIEVWDRTADTPIADITSAVYGIRWQTRRNWYEQLSFKVDQRAFKALAESNNLAPRHILARHQRIIKLKRNGEYLMATMLTDLKHIGSTNHTTIQANCKGILFVLMRRLTPANVSYSNDQVSAICWGLINATQQSSDIGITQAINNYSPRARDRTYKRSNIGEAIVALTRLDTGQFNFEFTPNLEFKTSEAGLNADNTKADRLIHHTTMTNWTVDEHGDKLANKVTAVSEGQSLIVKTGIDTNSIAKYGELEKVISLNDIILDSTVQEHASAEVNNFSEGVFIPRITLPHGIIDLNLIGIGDYIAIQLPDYATLPPMDNFFRIEQVKCSVDSNGAEIVTLTLDAGVSTADVQRQLDELDLTQIVQHTREQVNALGTNN